MTENEATKAIGGILGFHGGARHGDWTIQVGDETWWAGSVRIEGNKILIIPMDPTNQTVELTVRLLK